jgi:hypothetical protein
VESQYILEKINKFLVGIDDEEIPTLEKNGIQGIYEYFRFNTRKIYIDTL